MTQPQRYELVLTPPAQRAIAGRLPEPVATAVIDFLTTALITNPCRVGKQLGEDLVGVWSARRGTYRVLYRINGRFGVFRGSGLVLMHRSAAGSGRARH